MTDTAVLTKSPALARGFSRQLDATFGAGEAARAVHLVPKGNLPAHGEPVPAFEVLIRVRAGEVVSTIAGRDQVLDWARAEDAGLFAQVKRRIAAIESTRPPFAGLAMDRPTIMGIVNVTPDSFSDGGDHADPEAAVAAGMAMLEAGADILDVGGESTRPGSEPVPVDEEIARVVPVVRALAEKGARISIDTRNAATMAAALDAGARIVNDVTALTGDPRSLAVVAEAGVPVVLMHMQGQPQTMQADPTYALAPIDVFDYLAERVEACLRAGMSRETICVDPGMGFGKTVGQNAQILKRLGLFHGLGCPILFGNSRKTFIAKVSRGEPPKERGPGSVASAILAADQGVQILRVHDVAETAQALAVWRAAREAP